MTEREQASSLVSLLIGALILSQGPHLMTSSNPNPLSKTSSPHTITLGVKASTYEFEGDTGQSIERSKKTLRISVLGWNPGGDRWDALG